MKKLLVILTVSFLIFGCFGNKKDSSADGSASKGQIEVKSKGFVDQLRKQYAGKILIVNFFASWCPPCRGEIPDFVKAYSKYKDKNFVIIGISVDKTPKDAQAIVDEFKINYPVYLADESLGNEMKIDNIPASFIYKPDGKLFDMVVGPLAPKDLDMIANSFK